MLFFKIRCKGTKKNAHEQIYFIFFEFFSIYLRIFAFFQFARNSEQVIIR